MPKFYSLEQPPIKEVENLTKELKDLPKLKPRLTLPFPLNENRRAALGMIQSEEKKDEEKLLELLKSSDFIEKQAGFYLLKNLKLSSEATEKARPILERLSQDKNEERFIREAAIHSLGQFSERAWPILERLSQDKNEERFIREAAVHSLGQFSERAWPILERLSQDKNEERFIREAAAWTIKLLKNQDKIIKEKNTITKKPKFHHWLLSSQKPLFARPETKDLGKKIIELQKIAKQLEVKFKDEFIGLVIFGSTAKGYSKKGSDLDWGIIASNQKVLKHFRRLAESPVRRLTFKNLNLCEFGEHYVGINKDYVAEKEPDLLFCGLFFGNQQKLAKLQEKTLATIDEEKWNELRKKIMADETGLGKTAERFNIPEEELEKIRITVSLLRVPPSYQETLKIVQKRGANKLE